jgi:acetate kinase
VEFVSGFREGSAILAINCGSSSLKFAVYGRHKDVLALICEGQGEKIGKPESTFSFRKTPEDEERTERLSLPDQTCALEHLFGLIGGLDKRVSLGAVGHRIVHGGPAIRDHQLITPQVLVDMRDAISYAPLHLPSALAVIELVNRTKPDTPQIACLDTSFHRTLPDVSSTLPLPPEIRKRAVRRYGFHGLSLESVLAQMDNVPERCIIAHLGNGASVTAMRKGKSVDTTMAFTPSAGFMMGTRCGDLDPGVFFYLMRNGHTNVDDLEELLDKHSGLLGVSELSSDVRELIKARPERPSADLALRMFCYQVRKTIASMAAVLNGLDLLVFTGGIGEHAAAVRDEICIGLSFLGPFDVRVLPAQEELQIARITARLLAA